MSSRKIQNPTFEIENLQSAIDYVQSLDQIDTPQHSHAYHFNHGIARAQHLLTCLGGAPHITARCVLVAGSKGKGSTAAMLSSILAAAGLRVGLFTGPHLHSPLERFVILPGTRAENGQDVTLMPDEAFVDLAERVRRAVASWDRADIGPPTRFEAFTAMAYRWFEEAGVDMAVMEIGMGGRLDAVNLADPVLSVIANISLEHTEILGKTLPEIAREKAGIMRAGRPVVVAAQTNEVMRTLCDEARDKGATIVLAEDAWLCMPVRHQIEQGISGQWFQTPSAQAQRALGPPGEPLFVPLLGGYQLQNAATALAASHMLRAQGYAVDGQAMRLGLATVRWPGRFEVLSLDPVVIADGAHTPYSVQQLCESLEGYFRGRRIHFILSILRDKDALGMLEAVAGLAASVTLCDMPIRRATPTEQLVAVWNELVNPLVTPTTAASLTDALPRVLALAARDDVVCVTGSLHLVAEAEQLQPRHANS